MVGFFFFLHLFLPHFIVVVFSHFFSVQVGEEQPGLPAGLEGEARRVHTRPGGRRSQRQEQQRLWRQVLGRAHGRPQPAGEQMIRSASPRLRLLPTSSHPPRGSLTPSCPSFPVHKRETINDFEANGGGGGGRRVKELLRMCAAQLSHAFVFTVCLRVTHNPSPPSRPLLASWCIANQQRGTATVAETTKRRRTAHDVIATKPSCLFVCLLACLFVHSWSVPHNCCVSVKVAVSGSSSSHVALLPC